MENNKKYRYEVTFIVDKDISEWGYSYRKDRGGTDHYTIERNSPLTKEGVMDYITDDLVGKELLNPYMGFDQQMKALEEQGKLVISNADYKDAKYGNDNFTVIWHTGTMGRTKYIYIFRALNEAMEEDIKKYRKKWYGEE